MPADPAATNTATREAILTEVYAERDRQDAKWGGIPGIDRRDDHTYAAVLGEEFGETCQAWLERDVHALRAELVQTAAVAVAWIEEIDNGGGTGARVTVRVSVYGVPQPAGSKIAGRTKTGRLYVRDAAKGSRAWKTEVSDAAREAMGGLEPMTGPLMLEARFYLSRPKAHSGTKGLKDSAPEYPTKRPDTTKLVRAVEDALTGIVWEDDAQVVVQTAAKVYGEPARCELIIGAVE